MKTLLAVLLGAISFAALSGCSTYAEEEGSGTKTSPISSSGGNAGEAQCPAVMAPHASDCPKGTWVEQKNASGCVTGFDCVACPAVMAPPASECEDGTWVERKKPNGCVAGFDCVK